jgi:predicted nucleic acid-binding Zn ribbon protein
MRRRRPRGLGPALEHLTRGASPPTLLARAQARWAEAAGAALAQEAEPVSERGGTLTVACRSSVWAQELTLLAPDLLGRLNAALEGPPDGPLTALRFRVARNGEGPCARDSDRSP